MLFKFIINRFALILISVLVFSCNEESELEKSIDKINIDVKTERFDRVVAEASINDFAKVRAAYPFMFSSRDNDTTWVEIKKDTLQARLFEEVDKVHGNFESTELEIESLFKHIKYYFPKFKTPRVITTTSYVDYRNSVIVTDTIVVVALDSYLGSNHEFYTNIYKYISANLKKEQIVVNMAGEYAKYIIGQPSNKTFLDEMIYAGKQLYFKDLMIPSKTEEDRIGYTKEQLEWAKANESLIWRYFVESEMLFSTDPKLIPRFISIAPFSKFYLEGVDSESPGRIGQYIGWQIVRAFMDQNDVTIKELLRMSPEDIFNKSKFKPRK